MKRKLLCPMLLGMLLLLMVICVPVRAEPVASGTFGRSNQEMQWSVEGNTLYITGNGYMYGFDRTRSRPWDPYRNQIQRIVMTGTIENIGYYAFEGCTELTEIVWPDGLKYIYNYAFSDCTSLKNVTIPGQVETIYEFAFNRCTALEVVTMSESVIAIDDGVFYGCSALHTVTLSTKLQRIDRWCFLGCKALKQIQLPSTLRIIDADAFAESGLVKISIPEQVQDLGGTFAECRALEEVTFTGKHINILGSGTFRNCVSLTKVNMPAEVSTVYIDAFADCKNLTGIHFYGDMPKFQPNYIFTIRLIIYYPEGNTTWTQEAMDAFVNAYAGHKVQFVPTVYQIPEETVPNSTVQTPPVTDNPVKPTDGLDAKNPSEQEPMKPEPTSAAEPTEETLSLTDKESGGVDNSADAPTETFGGNDTAEQTGIEKEQSKGFPWMAICIGAAVLLAGGGVAAWFMLQKKP